MNFPFLGTRKNSPLRNSSASRRLHFEALEERRVFAKFLYVGTDVGTPATVKAFADRDDNGTYETTVQSFRPFDDAKFGAHVATGDFDGDENDELVVAAGPNGKSQVKIYDLNGDGTIGTLRESFFAFGPAINFGLNIAAGDANFDFRDELYISTANGAGKVRLFADTDRDGLVGDNLLDVITPFGAAYKGGVSLAMGDTSGYYEEELIVGQASGGSSVKIISDSDKDLHFSTEAALETFNAFAPSFKGGVNVAAAKLPYFNSSSGAEVMVSGASNSKSIRILTDTNNNGRVSDNPAAEIINVSAANIPGGVRVFGTRTVSPLADAPVFFVPGSGVPSTVKIYEDNNDSGEKLGDNPVVQQFAPFPAAVKTGFFVAVGEVTSQTVASGREESIPDAVDNGPDGVLTSYLNVPKGAGLIRNLDISLNIAHTYIGDLTVSLTHVATGKTLRLVSRVGGSCDGLLWYLTDNSQASVEFATHPSNGVSSGFYNPQGAALFSFFEGEDASGLWALNVSDEALGDTGRLYSWSLHFRY